MRTSSSLRWLGLAAVAAFGFACSDSSSVVGGPSDAGSTDLGALDTGALDTGTSDTGASDTGASDAGIPDDTGAPDAPSPSDATPTDGATSRCTQHADCAGHELGLTSCDVPSGRCVQCSPSADTCAPAQHCDGATFTCVAGCRADEGCTGGQRCDTTTHTCVACVTDTHCPTGQRCMGNQCVAGCSDDSRCAMGERCCAGGCVDVQANTSHCGACGTPCMTPNATAACTAGACAVGACTEGFANCDNDPTNGCEVDVRTSTAHCGACGAGCQFANAAAVCMGGTCQRGACAAGFADCNGRPDDGCEVDTRTTPAHCGACGTTCSLPNATAGCALGACTVAACTAGFANCDGNPTNGCETPTASNPSHCGACGVVCPSGVCQMGMCQPASCSDRVRNGAESDVDCGGACTPCTLCQRCGTNADCGTETCTTAGRCTVRREVTVNYITNCRGPGGGNTPTQVGGLPAGQYIVTPLPSGATVWSSVNLPSQGYFYRINCDNLAAPAVATPAGRYYASAAAAFAAIPTPSTQVAFAGGTLVCALDDNPCSDNQGAIRFSVEHVCP